MFYTGIGARKTPYEILKRMNQAAAHMCAHDFVLRSGGADGADKAFEDGVYNYSLKNIYLPWKGFNDNHSRLHFVSLDAQHLASKYHPAWDKLSQGAKKLMGRNAYQLLGPNLDNPSEFVLCWTPNGATVGGTGQSIRMAEDYGIPVFNFGKHSLDEITQGIASIINQKG